ncbi:hypothetical protein AB0J86_09540 [Micromonospora sp. NPDC049559]|uniref:hypothetical protein n=1 Tax=Micromonospora sp. NPDC049559 TaxID=3155923 RepID=UPI00343B1AC6
MAVAIIGLVGALLGAVTTLLGVVLTERGQARREEARWRRDQRAAAYDGTLRHLLRAANLRSEFAEGGGMAVVRQEHQREWFDDLVQAQFWLHQLIRYCDGSQLPGLQAAAARLDLHVARLITAESYGGKGFSILAILQECIAVVTASARADGGQPLPPGRFTGPEAPGPAGVEPAASQIPMSPPRRIRVAQEGRDTGISNIVFQPTDRPPEP